LQASPSIRETPSWATRTASFVVRRQDIARVITAAADREAAEAKMREAIRNGASTLDLLGLRSRLP
jgi:regulator of RNase E activity RraA